MIVCVIYVWICLCILCVCIVCVWSYILCLWAKLIQNKFSQEVIYSNSNQIFIFFLCLLLFVLLVIIRQGNQLYFATRALLLFIEIRKSVSYQSRPISVIKGDFSFKIFSDYIHTNENKSREEELNLYKRNAFFSFS